MRRLIAAAGIITLAGSLLVFEPGVGFDPGALLVVAACVCWGVDNCVTARIDQLGPQHVTLAKAVVAGSANLVLGLILAGSWTAGADDVASALVIGALGYGASITLWVQGARAGGGPGTGDLRGRTVRRARPVVGGARRRGHGRPADRRAVGRLRRGAVVAVRSRTRASPSRSRARARAHPRRRPPRSSARRRVGRRPDTATATSTSSSEHAHPHLPDLHHAHPH